MKYQPRIFILIIAFIIFSNGIYAEDNYEINLNISGVNNGVGSLEIFLKFFTDQGTIEKQLILSSEDQDKYGKFKQSLIYENGNIENDFYVFGRLLSKEVNGKVIGFLPLKLVRIHGRNVDSSIVKKERKQVDLDKLSIVYFGDQSLDIDDPTCWRNTTTKPIGLAARESYPFVDFNGFTENSTVITLSAIKDLIEYRFINTCPTWNRLRGILRDEMSQIWTSLNPKDLQKVLTYLGSINNLAATDNNKREVHKIYNEVLISLIENIGSNRLPNNQVVSEIVFQRHRGLIANHLNQIVWKLDDLVNAYLRQEEYIKCLSLFSEIKNSIPSSEKAQIFIKDRSSMQDKIISIFQTSTVCASKETNSVEIGRAIFSM